MRSFAIPTQRGPRARSRALEAITTTNLGIKGFATRPAGELLIATIALVVVSVGVYWPHLAHGGFYSDDWGNLGFHYRVSGDYGTEVAQISAQAGSRPILAALLPLPYHVFTAHPLPYLALALAIGVVGALLLYAVLRLLGLGRAGALVVAALSVVFPWAASTRLWATGSINSVGVVLYLAGLAVALVGVRRSGRPAVAWHVVALCLYVASVLTYEAAAFLALGSGLLYVARAGWRRALVRWPADLVAVGGAVAYAYTNAGAGYAPAPLSQELARVPVILRDGWRLAERAVVPVGTAHVVGGVAIGVLLAGGALAAWRGRRAADRALRLWLLTTTAAVVGTLACWALFVRQPIWSPLDSGTHDRINIAAVLPIVIFVYALARIAGLLLFRGARDWQRRAPAAAGLLAVLVGAGYVARTEHTIGVWDRAVREQHAVLDTLVRAVPHPRSGTQVLAFGVVPEARPGSNIPVFWNLSDLRGAAQLRWHQPAAAAQPVFAGAQLRCGPTALQISRFPYPYNPRAAWPFGWIGYGHAIFLDTRTGAHTVFDTRDVCRRAVGRYAPLEVSAGSHLACIPTLPPPRAGRPRHATGCRVQRPPLQGG